MIRQSERKSQIHCNLGSAYMVVMCNPGAVIVFHTPKACSHIMQNSFWSLKRRSFLRDPHAGLPAKSPLFVTGISDKDAIFGGEELLKQCLAEIIAQKNPAYILVVSGCTAGVIGDDVQSVTQEIEEETGIPILTVAGAGFMSKDYIDIQIKLLDCLLARFAPPVQLSEKKNKIAVVLGENIATGNENNILELKRLLTYFGYKKVLFPPNGLSKEEFALIPEASLIIPVGVSYLYFGKMQRYAEKMASTYQAACFLANYPRGIAGTDTWLRQLGQILNQEELAKKACQQEQEKRDSYLNKEKTFLRGKSYVFVVGYPRRFFDGTPYISSLQAMGVQLKAIVFHQDLTSAEKEEQRTSLSQVTSVPCYEEEQLAAWVAETDFILTTTELHHFSHQLCLSLHQVGTWGVVNLVKKAVETVQEGGRRIIYEF